VALTNARIIDGTGRAPIERGTIVIARGRITAVGPAASVAVPAGAQRVDAAGKTVVPGFVDAHAHLEQVGTLETGKSADFVVLNANPLDGIRDTRMIDSVWIAGARVAGVPPAARSR
jgi:imidazolonepropionase-like amidohydrolase